ncbi:MAG: FecR family protein [Bacteroidota bacterium]
MKYNLRKILSRYLRNSSDKKDEQLLDILEKELMLENNEELFRSQLHEKKVYQEIFVGVNSKIKKGNKWLFHKIAAAVVLALLAFGLVFYTIRDKNEDLTVIANNTNTTETYVLIDGSKITLKKGSTLKYGENYNENDRSVELTGEAFFEIVNNENKPFNITIGQLKTQVLGTTFNIKQTERMIRVTVVTGLVKVFDENDVLKIEPNQEAVYNLDKKKLAKNIVTNEYATSWMKDKFRLKQVSINEFAEFMSRRFDVKLHFVDKDVEEKRISITVRKTDDLQTVINKVNSISEIDLKMKENNIIEVRKIK